MRLKWFVYEVNWKEGAKVSGDIDTWFTFNKVKTINAPVPGWHFREFAEARGYTNFVKDQTITGGYFVNPNTGDCMHAVPDNMDVRDVYYQ